MHKKINKGTCVIPLDEEYYNTFFNDYFLNDKILFSKTNKISRISDNIVNLNPIPLYLNPVIMHYEKINCEIKDIIKNNYKNLDIKYYNEKEINNLGFFTNQGSTTTGFDILSKKENCIDLLKDYVYQGMKEILCNVYNNSKKFDIEFFMSNIHTYSNGTFIHPHTHIQYNNKLNEGKINYTFAYYVDDGDPDIDNNSYSGCISFVTNDRPYHIRPKAGTLLIWESNLVHYVNPFFSKSEKERMVITSNFLVSSL